jgi:hypothetical protein
LDEHGRYSNLQMGEILVRIKVLDKDEGSTQGLGLQSHDTTHKNLSLGMEVKTENRVMVR